MSLISLKSMCVPLKVFELFKYFGASLMALVVDLTVFSLALRVLEVQWFFAAILGFFVGSLCLYLMSIGAVFSHRGMVGSPWREGITFIVIGVVGLAITQLLLWCGHGILALPAEPVRLVAAGITFSVNYVARKNLLFVK